jgi:hypothetical protein
MTTHYTQPPPWGLLNQSGLVRPFRQRGLRLEERPAKDQFLNVFRVGTFIDPFYSANSSVENCLWPEDAFLLRPNRVQENTAGCNSSGKVTKQDASRAERFLQVDSTSQAALEGNPQKWRLPPSQVGLLLVLPHYVRRPRAETELWLEAGGPTRPPPPPSGLLNLSGLERPFCQRGLKLGERPAKDLHKTCF